MTTTKLYNGYSHPSNYRILIHVTNMPDLEATPKTMAGGREAFYRLIDILDGYYANERCQEIVEKLIQTKIDQRTK